MALDHYIGRQAIPFKCLNSLRSELIRATIEKFRKFSRKFLNGEQSNGQFARGYTVDFRSDSIGARYCGIRTRKQRSLRKRLADGPSGQVLHE
jgi:hypothetical protein